MGRLVLSSTFVAALLAGGCDPPPPGADLTAHCGDPEFAGEHSVLCFGGCKDPEQRSTPACAPCVAAPGDALCGGECTTDCETTGTTGTTTDPGSSSTTVEPTTSGGSESTGDTETGGGDPTVVKLVGGSDFFCALTSMRTVRCWGAAGHGLGYGNNEQIGDDEIPADAGDVDIGADVIDIDSGGDHVCVVLEDGGVKCWGRGEVGQLGLGDGTQLVGIVDTPADHPTLWYQPGAADPLNDPPAADVPLAVAISVGGGTCVLLDDERVWCWTGPGLNTHASASTAITFPVGVEEVSTGTPTCIRTSMGTVRCWGSGALGRLGYGNENNIFDPLAAGDVSVGETVEKLSHSDFHTCVITTGGNLRCWGSNFQGQLGLGHTNHIGDDELPSSVLPAGVGGTVSDVCQANSVTCVAFDDGTVRCFGQNNVGNLGYGHMNQIGDDELPSTEPAFDFSPRTVASIACASLSTCAVLDDGAVRCWGSNSNGQLGLGHGNNVLDADDNAEPDVQVF